MNKQERKVMEMALEALENGKQVRACEGGTKYQPDLEDVAIVTLRTALAQGEQTHPDHYAEVYIRVGDLHVKKVMTSVEFLQAYDPIKLISLVADDCVQTLKELS